MAWWGFAVAMHGASTVPRLLAWRRGASRADATNPAGAETLAAERADALARAERATDPGPPRSFGGRR